MYNLNADNKKISDSFLDENLTTELYHRGRVRYDWDQLPRSERRFQLKEVQLGAYEQRLQSLLHSIPLSPTSSNDRVVVLIGGIGTGKTTALQKAFSTNLVTGQVCTCCPRQLAGEARRPLLMHLDLTTNEGEDADADHDQAAEQKATAMENDDIWNQLAAFFSERLSEGDVDEGTPKFWYWCLSQPKLLARSKRIHTFLLSKRPILRAIEQGRPFGGENLEHNVANIYRERELFVQSFDAESLAWYQVFLFKYYRSRDGAACPCDVIWLDNIDQASPRAQRLSVRIVLLLADVLEAKAFISVRPLTWQRSIHGNYLVTTEPHYSPDLGRVLESRTQRLFASGVLSEDAKKAVSALIAAVGARKGRYVWLREMLEATSGLSVRWAIRNLVNMTEAPLFSTLDCTSPDPLAQFKMSELVRAYFFGTRNAMIPHAFDNLYAVGGDRRRSRILIKPRILDLLIRVFNGYAAVRDICFIMSQFGHEATVVLQALNELMRRTRPLIWCEKDFSISDAGSVAKILATPIGEEYYSTLFGELYYEEVCLAGSLEEVIHLGKVYAFHQELAKQDFEEIGNYVMDSGSLAYRQLYPRESVGISVLHAANLIVGLMNRTREGERFFDPKRAYWLDDQIQQILEPEKRLH